jgi:plastocyanin
MKSIKAALMALIVLCVGVQLAQAGGITGKVKAKGVKNSGDAIVYIAKMAGKTFPAPKEHAKMDQKNLKFVPHVLPIQSGTTVDFVNSDDVLHNVFSPDKCCDKFNLGSWPKGQSKSFTFSEPGCAATLLCNVHPEMEGYVYVVETPYYAVSAADGSYDIKDVPAGKYTLKIWHEKLKGQEVAVEVPEKGNVTVDFEIHK